MAQSVARAHSRESWACSRRVGFTNGEVLGLVLASRCCSPSSRRHRPRHGYAAGPEGGPTNGFLLIFFFPPEDLLGYGPRR
jgi:hypothetical protein